MVDRLSHTFSALADPTRRAILARLASGETTVNELSRPFPLSQPAITKHLKVLENAGLISRSRAAQTRPAKLEPAALRHASIWLEEYRQFWEESFGRLNEYLKVLQTEKPQGKHKERRNKESKHSESKGNGKEKRHVRRRK